MDVSFCTKLFTDLSILTTNILAQNLKGWFAAGPWTLIKTFIISSVCRAKMH